MKNGCSSGLEQCGCAGSARGSSGHIDSVETTAPVAVLQMNNVVARVNGVPLHPLGDRPDDDCLRQRAYGELLRQEAIREGLLDAEDGVTDDGVQTEIAVAAMEALLERNLQLPEPDEAACRRHYEAHRTRFQAGERVHARHILFAVTPGVDVVQLRKRAEAALLETRCRDATTDEKFEELAARLSNCPSGANGGGLGWLVTEDCAPEFARELFGHTEVGVLPRLVHSRFGLHVVEVIERRAGVVQNYETVRGAVALTLHQQTYVTALRQYLQLLASRAEVEGVALETASSPLVQ